MADTPRGSAAPHIHRYLWSEDVGRFVCVDCDEPQPYGWEAPDGT